MEIDVQLTTEAIPERLSRELASGVGAWVEFRGVVRGEENGQPIAALEYEAYSPMAEREMDRLLREIAGRHPCVAACVVHRVGVVPVGEAAIRVAVAGKHRVEAFALLADFMDRLKQVVPIWKVRSLALGEMNPKSGLTGARSAAEVITLVRGGCAPLETERVPLAQANCRVLREAVTAPEDQPAFERSAVDGYAVRMDDDSRQCRIVGEIRAGDWKCRVLQRGEAVRIATGGALPCDGLQVVMKEDVEVQGGMVTLLRRDTERYIRRRGEDALAGQELVAAGAVIRPGVLGLLASVGCVEPVVSRLPRVLHLATGNEIVAPELAPQPGQIRDSNSTLVRAFLGRWGIAPGQERVGEDEKAIESALSRATAEIDLLLISGGASVGEHDFTRRLLERAGFEILVSKTTARPGKPLIVARRGRTLAFGLPGNPLAHFVCLNLYVRAALEAWSGQAIHADFKRAILAMELEAGGNARETFWPATWRLAGGRAVVTPLRWSSSGDLTSLASANALIRVTAGAGKLAPGTTVEFMATK
jgi:molybdopterin molybdotransferase